MRRLMMWAAALALAGAAGYLTLSAWPLDPGPTLSADLAGDAARGAYIARASGCIGCHTDIDQGGPPLAGGPALETSFGTFRAPNVTTDPEHGIGAWSLAQFATAVREGVSPDGEPYYPAFPYEFYTKLSDQDVADLYAAFKTVPPVAQDSPDQEIRFPFHVRPGLKLWRALHFRSGRFEPDPDRDDVWNRGKYLVEGPTHCAACHTPRTAIGALDVGHAYAGADDLPDGGKSPPITPEALTAGGWNEFSIVLALRMGVTPEGDTLGGSMGEIVRDSTSFLTDADLQAIATYLLDTETSP